MSDTREKLIREKVDLINAIDCAMRDFDDYLDECNETCTPPIDKLEDFIADGVISAGYRKKQEWIPAKEPPKESGEYLVVIHKAAQATTLLYSAEEKSWYEATVSYATNPDGEEVYTYYPVDWWMPLPEPPKE